MRKNTLYTFLRLIIKNENKKTQRKYENNSQEHNVNNLKELWWKEGNITYREPHWYRRKDIEMACIKLADQPNCQSPQEIRPLCLHWMKNEINRGETNIPANDQELNKTRGNRMTWNESSWESADLQFLSRCNSLVVITRQIAETVRLSRVTLYQKPLLFLLSTEAVQTSPLEGIHLLPRCRLNW